MIPAPVLRKTMSQSAPIALTPVNCPHCGQRLPFDSRVCPNCGLDMALVTLLAERAYAGGVPSAGLIAPLPAAAIPKLGAFLLEQHLITEDQLGLALARQHEAEARGTRRLLGQTLVELGYVTRETIDQAVNNQILELHAALTTSNRQLEQRVEERTAELRRALERLSELNQLKANLISNVSHELRTPLAHIKGYTELMSDGQLGPLNDEQANALGVVRRATEHVLVDLAVILLFSRRHARKLEGLRWNGHLSSAPWWTEGVYHPARGTTSAKGAGEAKRGEGFTGGPPGTPRGPR